jgi:hypothetical protein
VLNSPKDRRGLCHDGWGWSQLDPSARTVVDDRDHLWQVDSHPSRQSTTDNTISTFAKANPTWKALSSSGSSGRSTGAANMESASSSTYMLFLDLRFGRPCAFAVRLLSYRHRRMAGTTRGVRRATRLAFSEDRWASLTRSAPSTTSVLWFNLSPSLSTRMSYL